MQGDWSGKSLSSVKGSVRKLAMELHDDLCPQLIGIEVMTKMLQQRLHGKTCNESLDAEADRTGRIRDLILDAIEKTRRLSKGLSPVNLTELGFDASLEELATYIREVFNMSLHPLLRCHFSL